MSKPKKYVSDVLASGISAKTVHDVGFRISGASVPANEATAAADPGTFSGILVDLDFQDPAIQALANDASVSTWGEASQPTAGLRPLKKADGVFFDGVDNYISFPRKTNVRAIIWVGHYTADNDNWAPIFSDTSTNPFHGGGSVSGSGGKLFQPADTGNPPVLGRGVRAYINGELQNVSDIVKPIGTPIILVINLDEDVPAAVSAIGSQQVTDPGRYFNGTVKRAMLFDRNLTSNEIIAAIKHFAALYTLSYDVETVEDTSQLNNLIEIKDAEGNILCKLNGSAGFNRIKVGKNHQFNSLPQVIFEASSFNRQDKWIELVNPTDVFGSPNESAMGIEGAKAIFGSWGTDAEIEIQRAGQAILRGAADGTVEITGPSYSMIRFMTDSHWSIGDYDGNATGRYFGYGLDNTDEFIIHGALNLHGHALNGMAPGTEPGSPATISQTSASARVVSTNTSWTWTTYGSGGVIDTGIPVANPVVIDGVTLTGGYQDSTGDRVLFVSRTDPAQNGIWVLGNWPFWGGNWIFMRENSADGAMVRAGMTVVVREGATYSGKLFALMASTTEANPNYDKPFVFQEVSSSGGVPTFNKHTETLDGTDITNQYVDLPDEAVANSLDVFEETGIAGFEGVHYTLSLEGGVTRVTFIGDWATGGGNPLLSGDKLYFKYVVA